MAVTLTLKAPGAVKVTGVQRLNGRNIPLPVAAVGADTWEVILVATPGKVRFATTNVEGRVDMTPHKPHFRTAGRSATIDLAVRPAGFVPASERVEAPAAAPAELLPLEELPLEELPPKSSGAGLMFGFLGLLAAATGGVWWWTRRR